MSPVWQRLPARTRLTLWYVSLLAGTLVALGGGGLWLFELALRANADELLRSKAAAVLTEVDVERGRLVFELEDASLVAGLDVVRIWDRDHRAIHRQEGPAGLPAAEPGAIDAVLAGQSAYARVRAADGSSIRLYSEPVRGRGGIVGAVQVGRSEAAADSLVTRLRLLGVGGVLAALALAWGGGRFLARRALAPVERITRAAERVGAEDLSQRLDLPPAEDEFRRLTAAFNAMIARLDSAFQRQRQFTADASHELRTPLAVMRSQAELALGRPREPAYDARVLTSILEESERLGRLVENLLVLARADAGQVLDLAPVDLQEVVADVGTRIAPRARERGVRLTVTVGEAEPVRGDATWLTQLLLNLLDNALRHTPAGGQVTLSLERTPDGAVLRVSDTGDGIAAEHLPHLFERFYRVDHARSRAAGGAGLGLAICNWVARAHGGRLEVASHHGRGTTVGLWLPVARTGVPSARPGAPDPSAAPSAPRPADHAGSS